MHWNHQFCSIYKINEEMHVEQTPATAYIFSANLIYVLQKETKDSLLLATQNCCFLFNTFFSQVSNKEKHNKQALLLFKICQTLSQ